MRTREDHISRRILLLLPQAFGAAATGLGSLTLLGWISGDTLLASFGETLIPMAPSAALLFVFLGLSIYFRGSFPLKKEVYLMGMALGSLSAAAALLLFYLSSAHIYSSIEHLGISITGTLDGVPTGHISPLTALICALIALSLLGTLSSSPERRGRAVAAFVLACILTLMSTALVIVYLLGTPFMYGGAFIPPALPSSLCSLFLVLAVLSLAGKQVWPSSTTDKTGVARPLSGSTLIFVLLSSGILVIGYVYHRHFERQYRAEIENVLASISDLKVSELKRWREERLGDAAVFYGNTTFSRLIERFGRIPDAVDARTDILTWFRQVREAYQYDRLSLYDAALVERLSYPGGLEMSDSLFLRSVAVALRIREIVFQDFYRDEHTDRLYLNVLIPILATRNNNRVIGLVAMRIDPDKYIYPLLKRWPTPSRTAETLLIRKDGNTALFLNRLKFNNEAALKLRIPLDRTDMPAVKAALGQVGTVEGRDYRGVPVISNIRPVPDSPWFLIARLDLSEVYAPLNERAWITVFLMCAMLIGAASGLGFVWRHQKAQSYKDKYLAERERAWLHDVIARSLNEIYVFDRETLHFKFANAGAQRNIGYTTEELTSLTALDIAPEYSEESFRAAAQPLITGREKVLVFETVHMRKDGTRYPVESHLQLVERPEGAVFLEIVNDITEHKQAEEVGRDSEERFRMVFENVFDGISIYSEDPDPSKRRLIECNDRYAVMAGRTREELFQLGSTQGLQITLGDRANIIRMESLTMGTSYQGTFSWIRPDGKENVIEYVAMPITWRGKPYSIGIDRDVTERKQAEREARLMAQTVASAQDCISITDLENRLLFVNDAFRATYGYTTEDLLGKDVSILRPLNTSAATTDQILHGTQGGGWHGEILNRRKDGRDFPVELWTSVVRDETGTPVAMVGIARDITDRKVAEEHIRQSEEQFRLIAENVGDMIAVLDLEGRRIYNSPSYEKILPDLLSLKGTDSFQEIHPEDVAKIKQVFQETVRTGVGQQMEYRFLLKDGSVRNIDSKGTVIRDSNGKISQVVVISRDVTEEKKLATQFLRAQRMESIGTLAGGIAHDLNNVLAPIMMAIEVLKSKILDPSGQRILGTIATSAQRGADIVKQVLAFGRGVKGDRILVQLKHVVNEVVNIAGETFPKSIQIKTDIPRDLWTVSADATQMHQVLLNLLVNARDAMLRGGTLSISAENIKLDEHYSRMHLEAKPGSYVCIAIADTGTGIPTDIREKIFDPFFTTKEIGLGTGLGLSTTHAIVKSHGGFINLDSEVGKGTTFSVYIPATGTTSGVPATSEEADLPMGNGELILIIDDEAAVREITKETLEANGYKTMTASDGAEGVALFAENKKEIKAVITDIMMPVMDGAAAIIALRKINPDVKIIAASGLGSKGQVKPPPRSSIQAFLSKPYTAEKLLKALAAVLR
jgi:PAS domain S-box-containing protein